jgi:hypothetical protein
MRLTTIGKSAAMLLLGAGLAGCIDATVDVEVTSETTARATLTQVMAADFYAMVKMSADGGETAPEDEFCAEGQLTEEADGSATCVVVEEGPFADLAIGEGQDAIAFTAAGPGLVRVSLPTEEMKAEVGAEDEELDAETRQMVEAFFAGHTILVRFSGAEVIETNMTLSADGRSAEQAIDFLELIDGTADLPDELFAVIRAP